MQIINTFFQKIAFNLRSGIGHGNHDHGLTRFMNYTSNKKVSK